MSLFSGLISAAYAADGVVPVAPTEAAQGSVLMNIAPILIIFVIFYFLVIRPQSKKIRAHQDMMNQLKKGDNIVTGGGFIGTVIAIQDDIVTIDLGKGMEVRALRQTLGGLHKPAAQK